MSLQSLNDKAFQLFFETKKKKILKSINIDNKIMGIDLFKKDDSSVNIKAIYLWNNMDAVLQQTYIDKVKDNLDTSYTLSLL